MRGGIGVGAAHDCYVVSMAAEVGPNFAELQTALTVFRETEWAAEQLAVALRFAIVGIELGARIPKVHMRSGTLKKNVEYALGLGRAGRRFGRKGSTARFRLRMTLLSQHTRECQCAKTGAGLGEPLAAGQEKVLNPLCVIFHGINVSLAIHNNVSLWRRQTNWWVCLRLGTVYHQLPISQRQTPILGQLSGA